MSHDYAPSNLKYFPLITNNQEAGTNAQGIKILV